MKRGATNNKGFSLVELIIVIAIMAILIGVMAPQLIKYIEKANVAADTQMCDNVRKAIYYAAMDPAIIMANDDSKDFIDHFYKKDDGSGGPNNFRLDSFGGTYLTCQFSKAVEETLGWNPFTTNASDLTEYFKSTPGGSGGFFVLNAVVNSDGTDFAIYLSWSDRYGEKQGENFNGAYDELEDSRVIYVK